MKELSGMKVLLFVTVLLLTGCDGAVEYALDRAVEKAVEEMICSSLSCDDWAEPAQAEPAQIVSVIGSPVAIVGQVVSVEVGYDVKNGDSSLTGIGLGVHYNSQLLTFLEFTNVLSTDNVLSAGPFNDAEDLDNDSSTDKYITAAWASLYGNWPDALPETLLAIDFTVAESADDVESTAIGFSSSSNAAGYSFDGASYDLNIVSATLDLDMNGQARR